jgi:hypothetical protein
MLDSAVRGVLGHGKFPRVLHHKAILEPLEGLELAQSSITQKIANTSLLCYSMVETHSTMQAASLAVR